jgi:hypothetical protein
MYPLRVDLLVMIVRVASVCLAGSIWSVSHSSCWLVASCWTCAASCQLHKIVHHSCEHTAPNTQLASLLIGQSVAYPS